MARPTYTERMKSNRQECDRQNKVSAYGPRAVEKGKQGDSVKGKEDEDEEEDDE